MKKLSTALLLSALTLAILGATATQASAAGNYIPAFSKVGNDKGPVFKDGCLVLGNQVKSGECVYGNPSSETTVVIFGDSHALHWTPALLKVAERKNWRLIALLRGNCTPALVNTDRLCNKWRRNSLARIASTKPSLVILGTNTGRNVLVKADNGRTLDRRASDRVLQAGMVTVMRKMLTDGSKVTLMRDLALAPLDPSPCVQQNPGNPGRCSFRAIRPFWMAFDFKAARKMKRVQLLDPLPKVCPGGTCKVTSGRILKFRDRFHMSATYAVTLSNWLGSRLQKP